MSTFAADKWNKKRTIILGIPFLLILVSMAGGLTLARYQDTIDGVAAIEPARFYGKIIGNHITDDLKTGSFTPLEFGQARAGHDVKKLQFSLKPGTGLSAKVETGQTAGTGEAADDQNGWIYFSLANGTNNSNRAEVPIQYNLQLITTRNLPLKFDLLQLQDSNGNGGRYKIERSFVGKRSAASLDDTLGAAYIYNFYKDSNCQEEATFRLSGDDLHLNRYALHIAWPIEEEKDKSYEYCKEIEFVEVRSLVTGVVDFETSVPSTDKRIYSDGYLLMHLPKTDADPTNETLYYDKRLVDMECIERDTDSEQPAEENQTAESVLSFGIQVYNGEAKNQILTKDLDSNYKICILPPADAASGETGYTLVDSDQKRYEGKPDSDGYIHFYDPDSKQEQEFTLRDIMYQDNQGTAAPVVGSRNYTLEIQNSEAYDLVTKANEALSSITDSEMSILMGEYRIRVEATYSEHNN